MPTRRTVAPGVEAADASPTPTLGPSSGQVKPRSGDRLDSQGRYSCGYSIHARRGVIPFGGTACPTASRELRASRPGAPTRSPRDEDREPRPAGSRRPLPHERDPLNSRVGTARGPAWRHRWKVLARHRGCVWGDGKLSSKGSRPTATTLELGADAQIPRWGEFATFGESNLRPSAHLQKVSGSRPSEMPANERLWERPDGAPFAGPQWVHTDADALADWRDEKGLQMQAFSSFCGRAARSRLPELHREITGVCGPNLDPGALLGQRHHRQRPVQGAARVRANCAEPSEADLPA